MAQTQPGTKDAIHWSRVHRIISELAAHDEFITGKLPVTLAELGLNEFEYISLFLDDDSTPCPANPECACCYEDATPFVEMMQCPEGHLFCKNCVRRNAESTVGELKTEILCMDQSECKKPFTTEIISKCVDKHTIDLLEKIQQTAAIREADVQGLEGCPFCDYVAIGFFTLYDVPWFHCEACNVDSCRACKQVAHPNTPCRDFLGGRDEEDHTIEEAMTKALVRSCPKCKVPFVKEYGCNRITCNSCKTSSCYICRIQLNSSYEHFYCNKCPLYDPVPEFGRNWPPGDPRLRHENEVTAAAMAAKERLRSTKMHAVGNA